MSVDPEPLDFQRGDSLIFTYDGRERSGQYWSEEPTCGVQVYGWADGRGYWVGQQDVRPETDRERELRAKLGYYKEDPIPDYLDKEII